MNFYDNLTDSGVFFFWIAIILTIFLLVLAIFLLIKNRKLATLLKEEKKPEIFSNNDDDSIHIVEDNPTEVAVSVEEPEIFQIEGKSEYITDPNTELIENKDVKREENKCIFEEEMPKLFESSSDIKKNDNLNESNSKPYQKNILREMSRRMPTSPIHIEKHDITDDDKNIYNVSSDLDGIDFGENDVFPLENMEDVYEADDNMKEIVSRMEEEIKPSNIELTDYEKKQEEEAIISYEELEKVKDKIYNLTEEEEDGEFIDELKNFRLDLR